MIRSTTTYTHHLAFRYFSTSSQHFPYKFNANDSFLLHQKPMPRIYHKFMGQIKDLYKLFLTSIAQNDTTTLKEILEKRLFRKFTQSVYDFKAESYSFVLHNPEGPIQVYLNEVNRIVGGCIDRGTEEIEGWQLMKVKKPHYGLIGYLLEQDPMISKHLLFIKPFAEPYLNIIISMRVTIRSQFKLDLKNEEGYGVIRDLEQEETHELTLEGVMDTLEYSLNLIDLIKFRVAARRLPWKLIKWTIVDVDGAMDGNKHSNSLYV
eukprot:TRINITY_DN122052_c0_g1_i1.p1 TRINITY_DN122052_c0_g1~~TRINITY_DN122052_c0_g1_i1.p1  ORF type:complete len:263 (-),score=18.13 TRINITY_DN122052_c0_g1_i1:51-839(-)